MPDIMCKLIQREKLLDSKMISVLVNSLHDKDGALMEQLHS